MISLSDPVSKLHLLGTAAQKALEHLGVRTVSDLLYHFPRDWSDLSEIRPISAARPGERVTIKARATNLSDRGSRFRKLKIIEALLGDDTGHITAVWFNQPYIINTLIPGKEFYFHGKVQFYTDKRGRRSLQLSNPSHELVKTNTIHTAGIIPEYPLTEGLTQKQIRYWLKQGLVAARELKEHLPADLKSRLGLMDLPRAMTLLHFPQALSDLSPAKKRLAFDELFLFQLAFQIQRHKIQSLPAPQIAFRKELIAKFVSSLPFHLTNSQRLACFEILQDLMHNHPMNRLLEGEVGSGKTVVAGLAMYQTAHANYQSILLAPTEILAMQHFETLKKLFSHSNVKIAILTRSHKTSDPKDIASGQIHIVVGTHALLQDQIKFSQIGLVVVDEQHRFGVKQRQALLQTNHKLVPHLLSMTATPIPRTLALAFYGDLDISQLRELPKGRKKVITRLVEQKNRGKAYEFIRKQLKDGHQAYVITPLVEEPDLEEKKGSELKSVIAEAAKLKAIFPEFEIELLHGRLKGEEKKKIMDAFKSGRTKILVSTTVVEVGVDVPNATIIIIENAERFGLAQLHQLRGRVGRSDLQSYCLLFSEMGGATRQRLGAVVNLNDGFELAEIDLKMRGSGEMLGTRQSGFIPFKIASLKDQNLIKLARDESRLLIERDPQLDRHEQLREKVSELTRNAHLE